jgi:hypothetical protein
MTTTWGARWASGRPWTLATPEAGHPADLGTGWTSEKAATAAPATMTDHFWPPARTGLSLHLDFPY